MSFNFDIVQVTDPDWLDGPEGASSVWGSLPHTVHGATPAGPCRRVKEKRVRASAPRVSGPRIYRQASRQEFGAAAMASNGLSASLFPILKPGTKAFEIREPRATNRAGLLKEEHIQLVLEHIRTRSRSRHSDTVKFLLSVRAGLRAAEIAQLSIRNCVDIDGRPARTIFVGSQISKSHRDRDVPMHPLLTAAIAELREAYPEATRVAFSIGRDGAVRYQAPAAVTQWFRQLYQRVGLPGASSHSGRRTFATQIARRLGDRRFHATIDNLKTWLGHAYLSSTQCYIEPSEHADALVHSLGGPDHG